jgi:hypothetical protein
MLPCNRADRGCVAFLGQHYFAGNGAACRLVPARFTRRQTRPCSAPSATPRPTVGGGRSCAAWNAGARSARAGCHARAPGNRLPAVCARLLSCGARPKASVREKDGHLAIAKFPRKDDEINTVVWEAVALSLAQKSGIPVPQSRVENIAGKPVLLLRRFDRDGERRIPFLSAMSMLGSKDNETRSYLEIVDALRQHGAAPQADMEALWRRLVFNILISNPDDHLRNHGFLYEGQAGWRLSPAYVLNPVPTDIKPRILTTAINEDDNTASLALAMEVAGYFELDAGMCSGLVVLVAAGLWARHEWREAKRWTTFSCVSSISQALYLHDAEHPRPVVGETSAWRTLDESESRSILKPIWEHCDCSGGRWWKPQPAVDAWGHPFHIAVRLGPNQRLEYVVSSSGPDGLSGSSDGIQSPIPQ